MLIVRSSLIPSRRSSLSPIAPDTSSRQHPFSAQSWFICLCWSINTGTSICRSLWKNVVYGFVLTSPAVPRMSCLSYLVCKMEGRWLYNDSFVRRCIKYLLKTASSILVEFQFSFFSKRFVRGQLVHPYITDTVTACKNSHFILLERLNLYLIDNLSVVVQTFSMRMLTSLSVHAIFLPRYSN